MSEIKHLNNINNQSLSEGEGARRAGGGSILSHNPLLLQVLKSHAVTRAGLTKNSSLSEGEGARRAGGGSTRKEVLNANN